MKKLFVLTLITLAASALLTGCDCQAEKTDTSDSWIRVGFNTAVRIITLEGHDYVLMDGYKCGTIIHAASCPCMKK